KPQADVGLIALARLAEIRFLALLVLDRLQPPVPGAEAVDVSDLPAPGAGAAGDSAGPAQCEAVVAARAGDRVEGGGRVHLGSGRGIGQVRRQASHRLRLA